MKQILRLSLVAVALVCSSLAKADTTVVGAEDNSTGWWSAFSETIKVEPNKTLQMEFLNYTNGVNNWNNFVVVLAKATGHSTEENAAYDEYGIVRADNYGWGESYDASRNSSNWYWGTFTSVLNGATVGLTVKRDGSEVTVRADVLGSDNNSYFQQYGMTIDENAELYITLTTEGGHLVIDNSKTAITDTNPEVREKGQVGKADNSTGFFGEYEAFPVMENETLTLQFTNHAGAANWNNFDVILANLGSRESDGYSEYAIIRADNFAWQEWDVKTTDPAKDNSWFTSLLSNYNWDTFLADMDGANVVLTIQRRADQVTVHADISSTSGAVYFYDFIMPLASTEPLFALLGVDGSHLVLDESKGISKETPEGIVGLETNTTPFFTQFSDYYYVAPGKTLNVSFTNHSLKQGNYQNFLLFLANAERDAAEYAEYAVLRADNFAWNATGNSVDDQSWFTSLESNYNWETFADDMDGATVDLKIERSADEPAKVTVRADITTAASDAYFEEFVINCGDGTQDLVAYLSTESGHLIVGPATIDDSVPTGIAIAQSSERNAQGEVYNLNGQRVDNAQKGIYIKNGKKFVVTK